MIFCSFLELWQLITFFEAKQTFNDKLYGHYTEIICYRQTQRIAEFDVLGLKTSQIMRYFDPLFGGQIEDNNDNISMTKVICEKKLSPLS